MLGFERALVSKVPGTTRDLIDSDIFYNSIIMELVDSAGVRETDDLIEAKGVDKSQLDSLLGNYPELDFPARFATLIGASGGRALHHLDPVLNIYSPDYQYRRDLPSAQIPPLFDFVRHTKLLDVIEELIGSEVYASPIYQLNILSLIHI